jgi:hypothetical protein
MRHASATSTAPTAAGGGLQSVCVCMPQSCAASRCHDSSGGAADQDQHTCRLLHHSKVAN